MLSELLQALGVSEVVGDYDWLDADAALGRPVAAGERSRALRGQLDFDVIPGLDARGAPVGATEPDEMATAT